ncbi:Stage II sporulation protein E (SpoIIE), partial [Musa troglodytarum]
SALTAKGHFFLAESSEPAAAASARSKGRQPERDCAPILGCRSQDFGGAVVLVHWAVTLRPVSSPVAGIRGLVSPPFAGSSSDAGKRRSSQGHTKVKFGFSLVKGKVNHPMEDYHVAKFVQMRGQELGLFAIFDGHMGHSVPAYLQKHLFTNILKEEEFWTNPELAIRKAYEKTDEAILSHRPDLGRGGSTAVTAILINGRKLWIANIGDSRAVLAKGQQVLQLTVDHDPSTERRSIENRGGFVSIMPGDVPRVNGQLAVSRAFGDKDLKRHLRSDPDVRCVDVAADTDLLILASDGIWKVMSNKEAIEIARKATDPQAAARQLTTAALERDSTDDISCIVIQLQV